MNRSVLFAAALLVALGGALLGQPLLTSISPAQTTAGAAGFTMTLNGSGFLAPALVSVNFGNSVLPVLTSTGTQITVQISAELLATPGYVAVSVTDHPINSAPVTSGSQTLTVNPPPVITTTSLNVMTVGVPFTQTLAASFGTTPYGNWQVVSGILPAGLTLNAATGVVSGTPSLPGSNSAVVSVIDSAGVSAASQTISWTVSVPVLTITTASPLPNATAGSAYSQAFAVTGGIPQYTWSIPPGSLQPGLSFSSAGVLSGTPTQGGTATFTVRATDASGSFTTKVFSLTVTVPSAILSVTGLTDTVTAAQQPNLDVQLSAAYPLTITGTVTLTFAPNAVNSADDPAIQFSTGGRTLNFTIPAGQTSAFPTNPPSIQTGTIAGQISLKLSYFAGGQNITPTIPPVRSVTMLRTAPFIKSVQVVKVNGGFNVLVTGYSTPRSVTQAGFSFTAASGASLQNSPLSVTTDTVFTTWYTGTSSPQFGSQFLYTQAFTVDGNVSDIVSVSVALTNATATSDVVTANF
jgi:hypothetical protein